MSLVKRHPVEVAVFDARLAHRASLVADVVDGLIQLRHPGAVVVSVHRAEVSLEVVLAVRRVAAMRTVETFLKSKHRFPVNIPSAVHQRPDVSTRRPVGDVTDAR